MRKLLWQSCALSIVWDFLFENDAHSIVSKRGREILLEREILRGHEILKGGAE